MTRWNAIAYGALDVAEDPSFVGVDTIVTPTIPGPPLALFGAGSRLWRRLVEDGPLSEDELDDDEITTIREMADLGLASDDAHHPALFTQLDAAWLSSPLHELVYAVVAMIARGHSIPVVFIKGPVLHAQGLRVREHSGDVDVWADPGRVNRLVEEITEWGWVAQPDLWHGAPIDHSQAMSPTGGWCCEIDVHRRMPGVAVRDDRAFEVLEEHTERARFAGISVAVPTRPMNALLSALHVVRPEIGTGAAAGAADRAAAVLRAGGPEALDVALAIDAVRVLKEPLSCAFGPEAIGARRGGAPRNWVWRSQPSKLYAYAVALGEVPLIQRPALLFRLVWPSQDVAAMSEKRAGRAPGGRLVAARLRRLGRGLAAAVRRQG